MTVITVNRAIELVRAIAQTFVEEGMTEEAFEEIEDLFHRSGFNDWSKSEVAEFNAESARLVAAINLTTKHKTNHDAPVHESDNL